MTTESKRTGNGGSEGRGFVAHTEAEMRVHGIGVLPAVAFAMMLAGANVIGQYQYEWDRHYGTAESHVAAAKAAAGQDLRGLLSLCNAPRPPQPGQPPAAGSEIPADPSTWHAEPAKVFDNLYFV